MLDRSNSKSSSSSRSRSKLVGGPGSSCCCMPPPCGPDFASWSPVWGEGEEAEAPQGFGGPSPMHRDAVTGISVIGQGDLFLVTAGRDGVVKIWS